MSGGGRRGEGMGRVGGRVGEELVYWWGCRGGGRGGDGMDEMR